MKNTKHTPGPWRVREEQRPIRGAVTRLNLHIESTEKLTVYPVATLYGTESKANATLIAAAPELLESAIAFKLFLEMLSQSILTADLSDLPKDAEKKFSLIRNIQKAKDLNDKAIAKAKGEA